MESTVENTPTVDAPISAPVSVPTTPTIESPPQPNNESSFEDGGDIAKKDEYKLVYIFTFALLVVAPLVSIFYHRQALNKLNDTKDTDTLKKDVTEVKTNLKKLMGKNYAVIN